MKSLHKHWQTTPKSEKQDFYTSLVVVALAGLLILNYVFPDSESNTTTEAIVNKSISLDTEEEWTIGNVTYTKVDSLSTSDDYNSDQESAEIVEQRVSISSALSTDQILSNIPMHTDSIEHEDYIDHNEQLSQDLIITDSATLNILNTTVTEPSLTDTIEKIATLDNQQDISIAEINTTEPCVILVGSYIKESNAIKMREQLQQANLNVLVTSDHRYTKVGVFTPCNQEDLSKTLQYVQANFAKDAVVLKPTNKKG